MTSHCTRSPGISTIWLLTESCFCGRFSQQKVLNCYQCLTGAVSCSPPSPPPCPSHSSLTLPHTQPCWTTMPWSESCLPVKKDLGAHRAAPGWSSSGTTRWWSPARMSDMRRRGWTGLAVRGSNRLESFTSRQQIVSRSLHLFIVVGYCVLRTINVHICSLFPNIWISLSTGAASCFALQLILCWGEDWS